MSLPGFKVGGGEALIELDETAGRANITGCTFVSARKPRSVVEWMLWYPRLTHARRLTYERWLGRVGIRP